MQILMVVLLILLLGAGAWLWVRASESDHRQEPHAKDPAPPPAQQAAPPAPTPPVVQAPPPPVEQEEAPAEVDHADQMPVAGPPEALSTANLPDDDLDTERTDEADDDDAITEDVATEDTMLPEPAPESPTPAEDWRAQLHDPARRADAILTLARTGDEAAQVMAVGALPHLSAETCAAIRDELEPELGGAAVADALVDALLASTDPAPKALIRDLLWHIAHEATGTRALERDDVLHAVGPLVLFQSVGPNHLDALIALSQHRRREYRMPALYGLASLALVDSGHASAAAEARARIAEISESDRSKPVRELATGLAADDEAATATVLAEERIPTDA